MKEVYMYETTDIYCATTLHALGYPVLDIYGDTKKVFVFDAGVQDVVDDYFQGKLLVDPNKLFFSFKTMKQRIYA